MIEVYQMSTSSRTEIPSVVIYNQKFILQEPTFTLRLRREKSLISLLTHASFVGILCHAFATTNAIFVNDLSPGFVQALVCKWRCRIFILQYRYWKPTAVHQNMAHTKMAIFHFGYTRITSCCKVTGYAKVTDFAETISRLSDKVWNEWRFSLAKRIIFLHESSKQKTLCFLESPTTLAANSPNPAHANYIGNHY